MNAFKLFGLAALIAFPLSASAMVNVAVENPETIDGTKDDIVNVGSDIELLAAKLELHGFELVSVIENPPADYTCHKLGVRTLVVEVQSSSWFASHDTWRCTGRMKGNDNIFGNVTCDPASDSAKPYVITGGNPDSVTGGCVPDDM